MSCERTRQHCARSVLAIAWLATSVPLAVAQFPDAPFSGQQREQPRFRGPPPITQFNDVLAHAQGILLVGKQYVAPPLSMRVQDGRLLVNDVPVASSPLLSDENPRRRPFNPGFHVYSRAQQIAGHLGTAQVVIVLENQPLVVISIPTDQIDLLRKLARLEGGPSVHPTSLGKNLPENLDVDVWDRWLAEFSPTPEFVARAREHIETFERTQREAHAAVAATRRLSDWSYPLSLIGMVAAVLGFGHLLSHRPPVGAKSLDIDSSPLAVGVLTWSLALVVLYSALDLTWSILAFQAGQMRELNPLGSHLIEDPVKLIAFKAGATAISVGLLFCLRKYSKAQLAAWWICLILTLLTARWLMMSSMMVA